MKELSRDATRRQEGSLEDGLVVIRLGTKCGLQTHMRCVCVCVHVHVGRVQ